VPDNGAYNYIVSIINQNDNSEKTSLLGADSFMVSHRPSTVKFAAINLTVETSYKLSITPASIEYACNYTNYATWHRYRRGLLFHVVRVGLRIGFLKNVFNVCKFLYAHPFNALLIFHEFERPSNASSDMAYPGFDSKSSSKKTYTFTSLSEYFIPLFSDAHHTHQLYTS